MAKSIPTVVPPVIPGRNQPPAAEEKPAAVEEKPAEKPADNPEDDPAEKPEEKPAEKQAGKHIIVPMAPADSIRGFMPSRIHVLTLHGDERMAFSRIKAGLIANQEMIDGKSGPRPVKTDCDVLRWLIRLVGDVPDKKRSHKANGYKR
jgi:hypothetical protein